MLIPFDSQSLMFNGLSSFSWFHVDFMLIPFSNYFQCSKLVIRIFSQPAVPAGRRESSGVWSVTELNVRRGFFWTFCLQVRATRSYCSYWDVIIMRCWFDCFTIVCCFVFAYVFVLLWFCLLSPFFPLVVVVVVIVFDALAVVCCLLFVLCRLLFVVDDVCLSF